ncbi:MAG: threonine--tRNA ligase [Myxococcales bacterium]|nr:threonine--tRNA ligase [Myxococcales bacterium]
MTLDSSMQSVRELLLARGALKDDVLGVRLSSRTDDALVDLHTAIDPAELEKGFTAVTRGSADGLEILRHSTAHVMADAVQQLFPGTKVTFGPATENGFYYDFDRKGGGTFSEDDLVAIEAKMREIIAQKAPFRREPISREDAVALFTKMGETYKVEWMETLPAGTDFTVYRHGAAGSEWVDFCKGPHVPHTGELGAIKLTAVSGTYWRGIEGNPQLQRIYGTAFPDEAALKAHLEQLEQAKARDHRKLGRELELFAFDTAAPASPFFLPRGAKVYHRLVDYVRDLYVRHGYDEVITPQIYGNELYKKSGHLANYRENMYLAVTADDFVDPAKVDAIRAALTAEHATDEQLDLLAAETRGVKPMNCPGHAQLFSHRKRSYRELPFRCADFGRLHRYERGGVVHGLARVRTFCQDDAHIFCTPAQMQPEISAFNALLDEAYGTFGFTDVRVRLATRPEKRVGSDALWDSAEHALADAMRAAGRSFTVAEGEGAFYGPKLEYHVKDAIGRSWQLGTMQVDFNMPERFELAYVDHEGKDQRPVMLHRALLGSLERFFAVYLEHVAGNFPVWLAPEQVCILTVSEKFEAYAREAEQVLRLAGVRVATDLGPDKLGAKIRAARQMRYPYLAVVGGKEAENRALALRRGNDDLGAIPLAEVVQKLLAEGVFPRPQNS